MVQTSAAAQIVASPRRRWKTAIECGLLFVLIVIFFARGFAPAWRTLNTDFPNYFLASVVLRHKIPLSRAYEWVWFQRQKDRFISQQPLVGFVPLTPASAVPLLPLTHLSALDAKRAWLVLNLLLLVTSAYLLSRSTQLAFRSCLVLAFLCVTPLRVNFLYGQFYVALLFLFCAAYFAHERGHRFTSGALIAVAAFLKLFPGGFVLLFLWKKNWRATLGLLCGALVLGAASVAMLGLDVHRVFIGQVFPRAMSGDFNPYVTRSLAGIWSRLFVYEPVLNPLPVTDSPLLAALARSVTTAILITAVFFVVRRDESRSRGIEWAIFLQLFLLLSTLPASYHYALLIFSAALGFDWLWNEGKQKLAISFAAAFIFSCAPWVSAPARLLGTLLMFVLLLIGAGLGENSRRLRLPLVAAGTVLASLMTVSGFRTLTKQELDYARRVPNGAEAYRVSEPRAVPEGLLVTEMRDDGYKAVILSKTGTRVISPSDALAVAGSAISNVHYIELSGRNSVIARVESPQYQPQLLFPGQQPSLSRNGQWLGFIREENGRGTAWIVSVDHGEPIRMTSTAYDVLELSATDTGEVYAAIGPAGSPKIVKLSRSGEQVEIVPVVSGAVRYPAVSPNGRRIAFSRLHRGSWQLTVLDLANRSEERLTDLPCNAIDPGWIDDHTVVYASDCGRGPDLTAISKTTVP